MLFVAEIGNWSSHSPDRRLRVEHVCVVKGVMRGGAVCQRLKPPHTH